VLLGGAVGSRALSNILAEAMLASMMLAWLAAVGYVVSAKLAPLAAQQAAPASLELLYCNGTAAFARVLEGGYVEVVGNSTSMYLVTGSGLSPLQSPALLKRGDVVLLSSKSSKPFFVVSGSLAYAVDPSSCSLSALAAG